MLRECQRIQTSQTATDNIQPEQSPNDDTPMEDDMIPRLRFLDANPDIKGEFLATLTDLIEYDEQHTHFIPTVDTITCQSYLKPLKVWCPLLNSSFMTFFLHEFKLQAHLSLLFDYYLFGNPDFVIGLTDTFFKSHIRLQHETCWPPRSYQLNAVFRNLLLDEELVSFSIRESTESSVWLNPHCKLFPLQKVCYK